MKQNHTLSAGKVFKYLSHVPFDHLDMQGVLHHSRHLLHVEAAAHAFFLHLMEAERFDPSRYPDQCCVVHKLSIDYLEPLRGVGPIELHLCPLSMRACSMNTAFELRSCDGAHIYSRGQREICRVDLLTLRPCLWSESYASRLRRWLAGD